MSETKIRTEQIETMPKFHVYQNGNQSISSNVLADVEFDTEAFDIGDDFNTTTYTWTCPEDGYYFLYVQVYFSVGAAADDLLVQIYNGSSTSFLTTRLSAGSTDQHSVNGSRLMYVTAGQEMLVRVRNGNNNDTVNAGIELSYFGGYKVA